MTSTPGRTGWLPGVEALRGIAAMAVVFHHSWSLATYAKFPGYQVIEGFGSWGVDLFFVLSGYLLGEWFWKPTRLSFSRQVGAFWVRRFFRIAPAYYLSVLVLFVFFAEHDALFSRQGVKQVLANATFTAFMFPTTASQLNVNGAWWTLTIEMTLYLFMPIMALAIRWRPYLAAAAMTALGTGYLLVVALAGDGLQNWVFGEGRTDTDVMRIFLARQFPGHLALFAIGLLLRWLVVHDRLPRTVLPHRRRPSLAVIGLLLLPSVAWLLVVERASFHDRWIWFASYHTVLALLFVPVILYASAPAAPEVSPAMRSGVWFGQRSYGIYLWHFPVILSVYGRGPMLYPADTSHIVARLVLIVGISVTLGAISFVAIEEPARRYGKRLSDRLTGGPGARLRVAPERTAA